jgi:hypothetical protein
MTAMTGPFQQKRGDMKPRTAAFLAIAMFVATIAAAQIKTLPGDTKTASATVTAIDHSTRQVTLKKSDGEVIQTTASPEIKRFAEIKVGDTITAKYSENLILRVMQPGEAAVNSATGGVASGTGARPSATVSAQRSITATITAIDPAVPSITVTGPAPEKRVYTTKVADREALKQVKVGDRLDVTFAAAVLVSVDAPKK